MTEKKPIRVLFVCTGNICRSPMAEAIFCHLVREVGLDDRFEIASAGTGSWHVGELPHYGTRNVLQARGVMLKSDKRALQLRRDDLTYYDYVVAMDEQNIHDMPKDSKIRRLLEFASPGRSLDVPDPYYNDNFDYVYDLVMEGCQGLLTFIREREGI